MEMEENVAGRGGARDTDKVRDFGRRALAVESNSVLVATIALIVFIGIADPDFLTWGQLKEVVQNSVYVGIIAAGMAFLISMREIDLSVGSMFGLALIISALLMKHGMNPWLAGLLGVLAGWRTEARIAFDVPPRAFTPPPKVTSSVVHLVPRASPLPAEVKKFGRVTEAAFGQRRKMLRQSLKSLGVDPLDLLAAAGIEPTARAEEIPVEGFVALARAFTTHGAPS